MNETLRRRRVVCAVLAGVLGLAGAVFAGQQPAAAAGGPIIAGLTPSSATTTVGTPVTLVGSDHRLSQKQGRDDEPDKEHPDIRQLVELAGHIQQVDEGNADQADRGDAPPHHMPFDARC